MTLSNTMLALLAFPSAIGLVTASPLRSRTPYDVRDSHPVPEPWTRVGAAPKDHVLDLHIGLKQGQFDELERHLFEVSDPEHHRYGQHLTADEVHELVKPKSDTTDLVHEWLLDNKVGEHQLKYSPAEDWVLVSLSVGEVEELLQTEYSIFKHEDGTHVVRTPEWSLPKHLHDHVDSIQPTNSFFHATKELRSQPDESELFMNEPLVKRQAPPPPPPGARPAPKSCNAALVTPDCLRELYGTKSYKPQVPDKNGVGMAIYLGDAANRSDVSLYLQKYRPEAVKAAQDFDIQVIAGGDNQQTPNTPEQNAKYKSLEAVLDAELLTSLGYPTPLTVYTTGGSPPWQADFAHPSNTNEPYLVWQNYVLAQKKIPQVISTSYADTEQTVPKDYAKRVCQQYAQFGARGITLLYGSGNGGVGKTGTCFSNDGKNRTTFLPAFPAGCPYVTAVGATEGFSPEVVAFDAAPPRPNPKNFSSGGGFSNYFSRPAYQDAVVKPYLERLGNKYQGLYNKNGRGYPDIAASGQLTDFTWNGTSVPLVGTSVASPTAAHVLTLVNDALIAAGKPPLGFLNPWLYSKGYKAFTDVTSGSSIGCGVDGFPAGPGWDAVSGWGTPFFPKIKDAVTKRSLPLDLGLDLKLDV